MLLRKTSLCEECKIAYNQADELYPIIYDDARGFGPKLSEIYALISGLKLRAVNYCVAGGNADVTNL